MFFTRIKVQYFFFILLPMLVLGGCLSMNKRPPIQIEPYIDLKHFMGPWYVIANIPTFVEKGAYNAVESYKMNPDGSIAVTFTFNKGSFNGKVKTHTPRAFVLDKLSNAVWGMQFVWPFKGDYRIVYVNPNYTQTIIGREKRDYVWIMAREPVISEAAYKALVERAGREGYDISKIQKVPQQPVGS